MNAGSSSVAASRRSIEPDASRSGSSSYKTRGRRAVAILSAMALVAFGALVVAEEAGRMLGPERSPATYAHAVAPASVSGVATATKAKTPVVAGNVSHAGGLASSRQTTAIHTPVGCLAEATLRRLVSSARDGRTIALAANACYRVDTTLVINGLHNVTIDGHGATLRASTQGTRNRAFWKIRAASNITLRNMRLIGVNPDGRYHADFEAQHGVTVAGSTSVVIEGLTVERTYGDGVAVTKAGDGLPQGSDGVIVRNSRFQSIGRQGVSITKARNVTVIGNTFTDVARSVIDLEPPVASWYVEQVTIENNKTAGQYGNMFVAGGGHGCNMHDIVIRGNDSEGGGIAIGAPFETCHKSGVLVEYNTFHLMIGNAKSAWSNFYRVDDVTVRGNKILTSRRLPGVYFTEAAGSLVVEQNTFSGTCTAVVAKDSAPVTESDNELASSCD